MTFYQIAFLFFTYSFLGWVGEVVFTAAVRRKYQDRGVLSGPLCICTASAVWSSRLLWGI